MRGVWGGEEGEGERERRRQLHARTRARCVGVAGRWGGAARGVLRVRLIF